MKIRLTALGQTEIVSDLHGMAGFFSWHRLATEIMRQSGELRANEKVAGFSVGTNGVEYYVVDQGEE